jgi:hypothetical protein
MDLLKLILNENRKKMQSMPPIKKARATNWSPPTLAAIKALSGVVMNMGLHTTSDITDCFSEA